jgi:hypothetical protein
VVGVGLLALKREGATPHLGNQSLLLGGRQAMGIWLEQIVQCILATLQFFFVMFLLRVLLRNRWLAMLGFVAIFATQNTLMADHPQYLAPVWLVVFSIAAYAVTRFGLITLAVAIFTANIVLNIPYTLDFSNWYAPAVFAVVLSFVGIAGWAFYTSLGGQRLWKEDLFE